MTTFNVSDLNGKTVITAHEGEVLKKKIDLPTVAFDALSQINCPTPNKEVQQIIAAACGWSLNSQGRCPKAAALLERITPGYGVFNGVISVMVGTSVGKSRFFEFNAALEAPSTPTKMLTRNAPSTEPVLVEAQPEVWLTETQEEEQEELYAEHADDQSEEFGE